MVKKEEYNLHSELQKEIEINFERERLNEVIDIIGKEILKCIDKRKEFTEYIVDYRKKVVEDYKDDEDKVIEYFDHERYIKEESYKAFDKKLKELTILKTSPYFGSVDFIEENFDKERIYIGKFGVTPEGTYEPLIVDWRAPVASLFYQGKVGEMSYDAPSGEIPVNVLSKRQFIIKKGELEGLFSSEIDIKDEILQEVLSKNSGEKLKDIIMTIQKEQDDIIRQPRYKTVVVNGVAGSGKTTIALHRVAYLLYNYRKILKDKVLILGPNMIFMDYISDVLPELGETGVKQASFNEFAKALLEIEDVMTFAEYMENAFGDDEEFKKEIAYKTSEDYIGRLDDVIDSYENGYYKRRDIYLRDKIVMSEKEMDELFDYHYTYMPLFRRSKKIKRIVFSKIRDVRDEIFRQLESEYKKKIASLNEEELVVEKNNLDYKRKLSIRELIFDVIKLKDSLQWLNSKDVLEIYNEINGNRRLTQDDLAPILYLKIKFEGFKYNEEIKHVVIDEAQDMSTLQFIVIKELTKSPAFTIVGDVNQRMIEAQGDIPMSKLEQIYKDIDMAYFELNKSYRSTREIMEYANSYLKESKVVPIVRSGEKVVEKKIQSIDDIAESVIDSVNELVKKGYESISVICSNIKEASSIYEIIKRNIDIRLIDNEEIMYKKGNAILPMYFSKGLEFDAVVMISHDENNKNNYVMATRALHELKVFKNI